MNKEQYLRELEARLSNRMSPQELENVMRYYAEYFDEAGPEREGQVIQELGTPINLVRQIMGEQVIRDLERSEPEAEAERQAEYGAYQRPRRRGLGAVWTIILAILAAPIAIPVIIGLVAATVALLIAIFAVFLSLGAAGVAAVMAGVFVACCGFAAILTSGIATTMYFAGGGMVTAGIGFLLLAASFALTGMCLRGLARLLGRMLHRNEGRS